MKKTLIYLKEIFQLLTDIKNIIVKDSKFFIIISILIIFYYITHYIMIYFTSFVPKETIETFYNSLDKTDYDIAWEQLSKKYKEKKFKNKIINLRKGYLTTRDFKNLKITYNDSTINLIRDFLSKEKIYNTRYSAKDIIQKKQLTDSGTQARNSFWIEVQEMKPIKKLKKSNEDSFKIIRVYREEISLIKENGYWKIDDINLCEIGLKVN